MKIKIKNTVNYIIFFVMMMFLFNCDNLKYQEDIVTKIIKNPYWLNTFCDSTNQQGTVIYDHWCKCPEIMDSLVKILNEFDHQYELANKFESINSTYNDTISEVHIRDKGKKYFIKFLFVHTNNKILLNNIEIP